MDWMRRQDIKEESPETPTALTPDEPDESYFEEDTSIDEGMVRDSRGYCHLHYRSFRIKLSNHFIRKFQSWDYSFTILISSIMKLVTRILEKIFTFCTIRR